LHGQVPELLKKRLQRFRLVFRYDPFNDYLYRHVTILLIFDGCPKSDPLSLSNKSKPLNIYLDEQMKYLSGNPFF
jgi:hypothetical protein